MERDFFQLGDRIGVTGHRLNRLHGAMPERLERRFSTMFEGAHPACRLISCMADGTDWIAAKTWPLEQEPLLPVPVLIWAKVTEGLVHWPDMAALFDNYPPEVLSTGDKPDYAALADRLIEKCDRLLAVWDGEPGRPGGTGSVVARARAAGKPVLHIPLAALAMEG